MRFRPWSTAALAAGALALAAEEASGQCVDEQLKQQLIGRRAYRGVVPRVIQKSLRHEVSALGGWYAPDLSDGAPAYGGAYTFHFSEDLALEASYLRTSQGYSALRAIVERNEGLVGLTTQDLDATPVNLFTGHLVWSLAYGKVRWFGSAIGRFDFHVALGAGATDAENNQGVTGSGGFGMKFYFTEWLALRFDVRDLVHQMRPPRGEERIVNDVLVLGGLSLFIPFKS